MKEIDYKKTQDFFEKRGKKKEKVSYLSLTMYQDKNPELPVQRDIEEKNEILPKLEYDMSSSILDIGCGVGRWAKEFKGKINRYLGIDFSHEFIAIAENKCLENKELIFQQMSAAQIESSKLKVQGPFDLIILSGILIYINDKDIQVLVEKLKSLLGKSSMLYIREPVSILASRKDLINHYSEDLESDYNAIYRTKDEIDKLVVKPLVKEGFQELYSQYLFDDAELNTRKETRQYYYILKR